MMHPHTRLPHSSACHPPHPVQDVDYPGLAMSRAFGDVLCRRVGVSAEPDVVTLQLQPEDRCAVWD